MLQPGDEIGPYTVEAEIGVGSTALVYRIRHTELDSMRALKVLSLSHPEVQRRIMQEGQIQGGLSHPNVVRVLDVLDVGGKPGLVLEYVDGPSFEAWLADNADASMAERHALAHDLVAGVAYAHAAGLVHRDLKPANILMEVDPDGGVVPRITDFGLAKVLDAAPQVGDTRTGHALGTPRYMSPEQIRSAKHVDARADVFSLGCLLYELYCRQLAFPQQDMLAVFNAVTEGDVPDPAQVAPEVPRHITEAIRACLQLEPADRPADAGAVLRLLDADPWTETAPPAPHRRNWMAGFAAISVGAMVGTGLGALAVVAAVFLLWWVSG